MNEMCLCLEESYSRNAPPKWGHSAHTLTSLYSTAAKRNNVYIYY